MVKLVAKSPAAGLLPITLGDLTLTEVFPDAITSVKPFKGQEKAVSAALKDQVGAAWPAIGRATGRDGARVAWAGLGEALVLGPSLSFEGAAVVDQTDGWVVLRLEGPDVPAVLARLTPLDLRDSRFKTGDAARSLLGHMTCLFLRTGAKRYKMVLFRSMAATAVHELHRAMESVSAQSSSL
ncbi:MAG: sarcosine oxidase subunit gamma family protein [Pseudomonadota bacterium]